MEVDKIDLKTAFALFKDEKHIDRPVMMGVLKDVFMTQLTKTFGSADNFDVIINVDKGDCEIYQNLEVVETVENPNTQISLAEVNEEGDDYELGETFTRKVELKDFGRRGILNIRQNLQGRIMDIEKANLYNKYTDKIGEIFTGEIYQTWSKEVLILDEDGNELRPPAEVGADSGRAFQEERDRTRHNQERRDEEQYHSLHCSFQDIGRVPQEAFRAGGA